MSKTTTFLGDEYTITYDGCRWVSPCNGQRHIYATEAMRAELRFTVESSGDDPIDYEGEIESAVDCMG